MTTGVGATPAPIAVLPASDQERAIATVVLAFSTDPMARWVWPDPQQYLASAPDFARAFGGRAFAQGTAHCVADYLGVALWLSPGIQPDEDALGALLHDLGMSIHRSDHETFSLFVAQTKLREILPALYSPREQTIVRAEVLHAILRPGGLLLACFYPLRDGQDGPPFPVSREDIARALAGRFTVLTEGGPARSPERRRGLEWLVLARRGA